MFRSFNARYFELIFIILILFGYYYFAYCAIKDRYYILLLHLADNDRLLTRAILYNQ